MPVSSPPPQPLSGAEGLGAALAVAMVGTSVFTIRAWQEQGETPGKNAENKWRREPACPVMPGSFPQLLRVPRSSAWHPGPVWLASLRLATGSLPSCATSTKLLNISLP